MNCPRPSRLAKILCTILTVVFISSFLLIGEASAVTIDVMLVYDTTATTWVNNNGGKDAFSLDAVNRMNQAAQNSNIDITFRHVHSVSVNYTHQDFNSDLDAITNGTGAFSNIDTLRDNYGADLVALMIDTGSPYGTTGLGWILGSYNGSPGYAYTTSAIRSVAISHTLTHEVGHNMGAHHSKFQTSGPGPNTYINAPYSAGWYFTGTNSVQYHTIMAYSSDGHGNYYSSAPLFSSPLLNYQGTTAGDAQDGDNSRLIRDTMNVVAGYRDAEGSLSVTIEPQNAQTDGAQWRRVGTTTWHNSGYAESNLLSGQYVIEFKTVDGWEKPADITVDVYAEQTAGVTGTYTPVYVPVGSLTIFIEPQNAITEGAQWRRVGTAAWHESGYLEEYLPVGQYVIEFKEVDGWSTPENTDIDIFDTQTTASIGLYSIIYIPVGSLNITLLPPEAVEAGAQWRRTETTTWYDSGSTEGNIETGEYTIEFKAVEGWTTPDEINVNILNDQTSSASGAYIDKNPSQPQSKAMPWMLLLLAE